MSLRVLLTGFRPWADVDYNPSGEVARALDGEVIHGAASGVPLRAIVTSRVFDVAWDAGDSPKGPVLGAATELAREVATLRPHILVGLGVMPASRTFIDVEALADDYSHGDDVRGRAPKTPRLHTRWPKTVLLPFPGRPVIDALVGAGFHAGSELGAGRYLCERIAYESARLARMRDTSLVMAGFIHVPNPILHANRGYQLSKAALSEEAQGGAEGSVEALAAVEAAEEELVRALRLALTVCVGQVELGPGGRPRRWSLRRDWLPDVSFPASPGSWRLVSEPIPGSTLPKLER